MKQDDWFADYADEWVAINYTRKEDRQPAPQSPDGGFSYRVLYPGINAPRLGTLHVSYNANIDLCLHITEADGN